MSKLSALFRHYFNLDRDKDSEAEIIASITRGISFRGSNLWTLVFAVIIASVGLNVNSTAVIIGAMLISPLMGPIMGVGLGIGISDFELVRRGIKNLIIAIVFSITTSTLYFFLSPLHNPTSELLARTTPTIWDVFIAIAGGLAGVVGATRREKGNVIPGVAIATALMPPLCTVGYGIATQHWFFSLGALYLFFINSVFICIATVLVVRFMQLHRHVYETEARRRRVNLYIILIVAFTAAPSLWLAYRIVQKAVFENAAQNFVRREFNYPNTQVINKTFISEAKQPKIEVLLIGQLLDSLQIDSLRRKMPSYGLNRNTELIIRQGLNAQQQINFAQIKANILDEVFKSEDSNTVVFSTGTQAPALPDLTNELHALYPQILSYSLNNAAIVPIDSTQKSNSIVLFVGYHIGSVSARDSKRLSQWLRARLAPDSVQIIFQRMPKAKAAPASQAARSSVPGR